MLLAGFWFGPKKPLMQTYLQPIFDNLAKLEKGVRIKTMNGDEKIHGYLLFGTADLPARAMSLNMVQYNGFNSCHKCVHPGETLAAGHGYSHVYKHQLYDSRTDESV